MSNGTDPGYSIPELPRRDRMKRRMSEPLTIGHVLKIMGAALAVIIPIGGGFLAYGELKTESKLTDATTVQKLQALETKHDKDLEQSRKHFKEMDDDIHEVQTTQAVMKSEQKSQTDKLDRILLKLEDQ